MSKTFTAVLNGCIVAYSIAACVYKSMVGHIRRRNKPSPSQFYVRVSFLNAVYLSK